MWITIIFFVLLLVFGASVLAAVGFTLLLWIGIGIHATGVAVKMLLAELEARPVGPDHCEHNAESVCSRCHMDRVQKQYGN